MGGLFKLRGEHAAIMGIVERLGYLVSHSSPAPQLHVFAMRHQLSSALIAHLETEEWLLYPRLIASADPDIAATASAFSQEAKRLKAAYVEHCQTWNAHAIAADWAGYCAASRGLIDMLNKRITSENRELFPLLERLDQAA